MPQGKDFLDRIGILTPAVFVDVRREISGLLCDWLIVSHVFLSVPDDPDMLPINPRGINRSYAEGVFWLCARAIFE